MLLNFITFHIGGFACVLGGANADYAETRLSGVSFDAPVTSLIAVGGMWTLAMPLLRVIASRWNGVAETAPASGARGTSGTAGRPT